MTTPRDKVMAAVSKGLELVTSANVARLELLRAKQVEDEVRLSDPTKQIAETANNSVADCRKAADEQYGVQVAEAGKPLAEAQAVCNRLTGEARARRDAEVSQAEGEAAKIVREAQREQETKAAIARAGVHTCQQNIAAIEANIDRYAREVEKQLGVNLKQLLAIARD